MNYLTHTLAFAVGASIGAAATYILVKRKYEKKASEDIEAMKKHYQDKDEVVEDIEEEEVSEEPEQQLVEEYKLYTQKYTEDDSDRPFLIDEETYHEYYHGYDKVHMTYYEEDGTLADDDYVYDDIDYAIGADNLEEFNSHDVIYIRNHNGGYDAEVRVVKGSYDYENR